MAQKKTFPTLCRYFQEVCLGRYEGDILQAYWTFNLEHVWWISCVSVNIFHVIHFNKHGNKNTFLPAFFWNTERKDLQQPEPQRSVSALTAQHCSLLCPVISCLMWLGCPEVEKSSDAPTHVGARYWYNHIILAKQIFGFSFVMKSDVTSHLVLHPISWFR